MPSPACTETAVAGKVLSGVEVASTIRSIDCASTPAAASAARAACERQVGGGLALGRDVALADAGALHDPFVGGVDHPRQLGIGEDAARQIAAAAEHDRTQHGHEAAPPTACGVGGSLAACASSVWPILASSSWRTMS